MQYFNIYLIKQSKKQTNSKNIDLNNNQNKNSFYLKNYKKNESKKSIENKASNATEIKEPPKTTQEKAGRIVLENTIDRAAEKVFSKATTSATRGATSATKVAAKGVKTATGAASKGVKAASRRATSAGAGASIAAAAAPFIMAGINKQDNRYKKIRTNFKNKNILGGLRDSAQLTGDVFYQASKASVKGGIDVAQEKDSKEGKIFKVAVGDAAINAIPGVGTIGSVFLDEETKEKFGEEIIKQNLKPITRLTDLGKKILNKNKTPKEKAIGTLEFAKGQAINSFTDLPESAVNITKTIWNGTARSSKRLKNVAEKKIGKDTVNKLLVGSIIGSAGLLLSKENTAKVAKNIYKTAETVKLTGDSIFKTTKNATDAIKNLFNLKNPKKDFKQIGNSIAETGKNIRETALAATKTLLNATQKIGSSVGRAFKDPKKGIKNLANATKGKAVKIANKVAKTFKFIKINN